MIQIGSGPVVDLEIIDIFPGGENRHLGMAVISRRNVQTVPVDDRLLIASYSYNRVIQVILKSIIDMGTIATLNYAILVACSFIHREENINLGMFLL